MDFPARIAQTRTARSRRESQSGLKCQILSTSAQLQGASLDRAHLEDASLDNAHLEGASLEFAQLQGAILQFAHLRAASLGYAHFEGAVLNYAELQAAAFNGAQLQGASLIGAHLEGAGLNGALQGALLRQAHLQGASLTGARLQGADLNRAQLQGASLQGAFLDATDLSDAYLWRTGRPAQDFSRDEPPTATAVKLSDARDTWRPSWIDGESKVRAWNDEAYQDLRKMMESLPPGDLRNYTLDRIRSLDCANLDASLASCDPSLSPSPEAAAWRKSLENARVDDAVYAKALVSVLQTLICSGDDNALYVLRGLMPLNSIDTWSRLAATGTEAPALIDFIIGKDCPVSSSLTAGDKTELLRIKWDAPKKPGS